MRHASDSVILAQLCRKFHAQQSNASRAARIGRKNPDKQAKFGILCPLIWRRKTLQEEEDEEGCCGNQ